jgi:hypothetical protein
MIPISNGIFGVLRRGKTFDFDAVVDDGSVGRLCHAASSPPEMRDRLAQWVRLTAIFVAQEKFEREDDAGAHFTRQQLRTALRKLARPARQGNVVTIPSWLQEQLYIIQRARLFHVRLGYPCWHPVSETSAQKVSAILAEADDRVFRSLSEPAELTALIDDALDTLRWSKPRPSEAAAREGQRKSEIVIVTDAALSFWIGTLERPPSASDKLIAFADGALREFGIKLRSASAVRAHVEAAFERRRSQP